ncbi:MAG: hypothetical protein GEU97_10120 [Actinophytocola sp.]|nr:hypothetical protein [Actinophytocola sp.]
MTATAEPIHCERCGRDRAADTVLDALAWVSDTDAGGTRWLCPDCARSHVRDIEGKLPREYW